VVIISVVMNVIMKQVHVIAMDKKIVMLSLLCLMNVTAMCLVLHQVEVELDLLGLKGEELDLKEKQVLLELQGLRVLLELQGLRVLLEKQGLLENKGYKVLQDLQDL
jgi:hypothetical protein